jgi:two-component system, sensor histidine kinase and response regulator
MKGYRNIQSTTDSRDVIQMVENFKPDLILLDLAMPFLSGFDIMNQLKTVVPKEDYLPILVLTADITLETKRKALLNGANDFLSKPFDLIELQARVNTHLEIKFKNQQINKYTAELEKLIATKDKFFSIIAHDVRNPFVGIANFSKIMMSKFDSMDRDQIRENIEIINKSALQGQELLENLLKWSRSQTGTIKINIEELFLNELIEKLISESKSQANNKKIKLLTHLKAEIVLQSDKDMLETIMRNLITNAIKFTPEGGFVSVSAIESGDNAIITITDTGIGISSEDTAKLFRIDSKLQSRSGTANETGSGLGLILCKEFVDKLDGTISVLSKVNEGTKFILTFPLCV